MIFKPRHEPYELMMLRNLQPRMTFSEQEKNHYTNIDKGYQGEQLYDERMKVVQNDFLVLNDLLFEVGNSYFQIDSLLITQNKILLTDVKNFEDDFFIKGDKWYTYSQTEIKNPLLQLTRSESLLRRLFQSSGFNIPIESSLVFINPEFYLYQAPLNLPIIFPTQVNRFINKLNRMPSKLSNHHWQLAEKLMSKHIDKNPFDRIPDYSFSSQRKGITCAVCNSFYTVSKNHTFTCNKCGFIENIKVSVLRSIRELMTLFPDQKITLSIVYEWCDGQVSKPELLKILSGNFKSIKRGRGSYYIDVNE